MAKKDDEDKKKAEDLFAKSMAQSMSSVNTLTAPRLAKANEIASMNTIANNGGANIGFSSSKPTTTQAERDSAIAKVQAYGQDTAARNADKQKALTEAAMRTQARQQAIDTATNYDNWSNVGKFARDLGVAGVEMIPSMVIGGGVGALGTTLARSAGLGAKVATRVGGALGNAAGSAAFMPGAYTSSLDNALLNGADLQTAQTYARQNAMKEAATEAMFGIPGVKGAYQGLVKAADRVSNPVLRGLASTGIQAAQEGIEEGVANIGDVALQRQTWNPNAQVDGRELLRDMAIGAIVGGGAHVAGGGLRTPSLVTPQQQTQQSAPVPKPQPGVSANAQMIDMTQMPAPEGVSDAEWLQFLAQEKRNMNRAYTRDGGATWGTINDNDPNVSAEDRLYTLGRTGEDIYANQMEALGQAIGRQNKDVQQNAQESNGQLTQILRQIADNKAREEQIAEIQRQQPLNDVGRRAFPMSDEPNPIQALIDQRDMAIRAEEERNAQDNFNVQQQMQNDALRRQALAGASSVPNIMPQMPVAEQTMQPKKNKGGRPKGSKNTKKEQQTEQMTPQLLSAEQIAENSITEPQVEEQVNAPVEEQVQASTQSDNPQANVDERLLELAQERYGSAKAELERGLKSAEKQLENAEGTPDYANALKRYNFYKTKLDETNERLTNPNPNEYNLEEYEDSLEETVEETATPVEEQITEEPVAEEPKTENPVEVKRGPGRPKGSKNKPKEQQTITEQMEAEKPSLDSFEDELIKSISENETKIRKTIEEKRKRIEEIKALPKGTKYKNIWMREAEEGFNELNEALRILERGVQLPTGRIKQIDVWKTRSAVARTIGRNDLANIANNEINNLLDEAGNEWESQKQTLANNEKNADGLYLELLKSKAEKHGENPDEYFGDNNFKFESKFGNEVFKDSYGEKVMNEKYAPKEQKSVFKAEAKEGKISRSALDDLLKKADPVIMAANPKKHKNYKSVVQDAKDFIENSKSAYTITGKESKQEASIKRNIAEKLKGSLDDFDNLTEILYDIEDLANAQAKNRKPMAKLSTSQQNFFKDSKVRDENGNLMKMYHGTENSGFHSFMNENGRFFFTDRNLTAKGYSGTEDVYRAKAYTFEEAKKLVEKDGYEILKNGDSYSLHYKGADDWSIEESTNIDDILDAYNHDMGNTGSGANYEVYLNITNPLVVDANGRNWDDISFNGTAMTTNEIADYAKANGYDGVIINNVYDDALYNTPSEWGSMTEAIAFNANQIKSTANENPTESDDIRYKLGETNVLEDAIANAEDIPIESLPSDLQKHFNTYGSLIPGRNERNYRIVRGIGTHGISTGDGALLNADTLTTEQLIASTIAHEGTHEMRTEKRNEVSDLGMAFFLSADPTLKREDVINAKKAEYAEQGIELTDEEAIEEIGADFMEIALAGDLRVARQIANQNPNFAQKILKFLQDLLQDIRFAVTGKYGNMEDEITATQYRLIKQAQNVYAQALSESQNRGEGNTMYRLTTDDIKGVAKRPMEWLEKLAEKNGRIEPGERTEGYRDVAVPKTDINGNKVSMAARTVMEAGNIVSDEAADIYAKEIIAGSASFQHQDPKQALADSMDSLSKELESNGGNMTDIVDQFDNRIKTGGKVSEKDLLKAINMIRVCEANGEHDLAAKTLANFSVISSEVGYMLSLTKQLKRVSPEYRTLALENSIDRMLEGEFKSYNISKDEIQGLLDQMRNADTDAGRDAAYEAITDYIAGKVSKFSPIDALTAWRYFSMLSSPRTQIRNKIGNYMMAAVKQPKDFVRAQIENAYEQSQGKPIERFVTSKKVSSQGYTMKDYAKFAEDYYDRNGLEDILGQYQKYNDLDSDIQKKLNPFGQGAVAERLNNLTQIPGEALNKADMERKRSSFIGDLASYMMANDLELDDNALNTASGATIDRGVSYAIQEARRATFTEENKVATKIGELERSSKAMHVLIGAMMPFRNTPLNILNRGIQYSPIGLTKSLLDWRSVVNGTNTEMSMQQVINEMAEGLTGSAIMGLGALLAALGYVNASGDDDDTKAQTYGRHMGDQEYAFIDPYTGNSLSIDWMSPVAMPFLTGAELVQQLRRDYSGENDDIVAAIVNATMGIAQPVFEMSCLQGVQNVLNTYNSGYSSIGDVVGNTIGTFAGQVIPTPLGQIARTVDDTMRRTTAGKGEGTGASFIKQQEAKIPGLSKTMEANYNVWGEERKREFAGNNPLSFGLRLANNMINPANFSSNKRTELDYALEDLYKQTGDNAVLPYTASTYVKNSATGNQALYMNAKEYSTFAQTKGQKQKQYISELMDTSYYKSLDYAEQAEMVKKMYTIAKYEAEKEFLNNRGIEYDIQNYDLMLNAGFSPGVYYAIDKTLDDIQTIKDSNGKTVTTAVSQKRQVIEDMHKRGTINDEQYWALFESTASSKADKQYVLKNCPYEWIVAKVKL